MRNPGLLLPRVLTSEYPSVPRCRCLWEAAGHTLHPGPSSCSAGDEEGRAIRSRGADPGQSPLPPTSPQHTRAVLSPSRRVGRGPKVLAASGSRVWRGSRRCAAELAQGPGFLRAAHRSARVRRNREGEAGAGGEVQSQPDSGWSGAALEAGDRERRRTVVECCGCVCVCGGC